ncbi:DUF2303 family protein [Paenalcaligenes suwonensis]|uniref:DUF2303 family protein n=1 Tax=Paenalcaligenes suwonensis TaxID=1202713 RepID=UPI00140BC51A|nr:DUF2303 family protein [Paenalcaligenes suwonensis]NHC63059.1 YfdQ family protein [Paenalcaligenes suwonensis]
MEKIVSDALAAGAALGKPVAIPGADGAYAIVPDGYSIITLESHLPTPTRKTGAVVTDDAGSFIQYFNKHATDTSQIYAKLNPPSFTGVLNDHTHESAGWKDHRVKYACPFSPEWLEWSKSDGKAMKQAEFAEFIERNLPDIVEPAGADMLEISRSLQAKKQVNFSSGIRLQNGQTELTYEEEIKGTSSKGKLQIPETFKIGIAVLDGGEGYKIECRLRYRINDANLVMWYEMVRPHKIIEDAARDVFAKIATETGQQILRGTP